MSESHVKGMAVINARDWLDERLGAGWYARTAREHDPEWPDRILPGDWYSVLTSLHTYERAFEQLDGFDTVEDLMARVTIEVALNDLNGVLRAFLWVASPRMFLRASPRIWDTYADFATAEIVENENKLFRAHVRGIPADVCSWTAAAWRGFLPPALELAGGKDPQGEIGDRRQTPGAETWEFVYTLRYD